MTLVLTPHPPHSFFNFPTLMASLSLAMTVEDAKLMHHLRESLARQVIDLELVSNSLREVSQGGDEVRLEAAARVLSHHHVNLNRQISEADSL